MMQDRQEKPVTYANEIMHTIYVSGFIKVKQIETFDLNLELSKQFGLEKVNFEEMPVCPMCLEKIDTSASGL